MRPWRLVLAGTAAAIAVAVVVYALVVRGEVRAERYADYAAARAAGAVRRGWIPPFVPPSATDIRQVHDLDSNAQWLRFRVCREDAQALLGAAEILNVWEVWGKVAAPPRDIGRWPEQLTRPKLYSPPAPFGLELRKWREPGPGARCIAVDVRESWVYAWSCPPAADDG